MKRPGSSADTGSSADQGQFAGGPLDPDGSWRDVPLPPDPEPEAAAGPPDDPWPMPDPDPDDGERLAESPAPAWPPLPTAIMQRTPVFGCGPPGSPPPGGSADDGSARWDLSAAVARAGGRPPPGLLDLTLSWDMLTGRCATPAQLNRIGPITASQALPLATMAALHPNTTWRVILTDPGGVALAVERVRRRSRSTGEPGGIGGSGPWPPGVISRVSVVMPLSDLQPETPGGPSGAGNGSGAASSGAASSAGTGSPVTGSAKAIEDRGQGPGIRPAVWRAAIRAAQRARRASGSEGASSRLCAHDGATAAYRPTTLLREFVEARDQTCRQPTCGQPARHADLDHTRPWDQGGPTCWCNLGPRCRTHHQIKQLPGWALTQSEPGVFHLTTPARRTYVTRPDPYLA
jgi:hypothetical protein